MAASTSGVPLTVQIPPAGADRPQWKSIAVITVIGFVIGVAWPRLAGIRPGPSVPENAPTTAPSATATAPTTPSALPTAAAITAPAAPATAPAPATATATTTTTTTTTTTAPTPARAPAPATPPAPALAASPSASPHAHPAASEVSVTWRVGLVRSTPKNGKIVARLPRGTTVRVGPEKDGWYPVRYGEDFASEGWLYRGAIGR
jgi:glucose/arabinose dehydrogenase